MSEDLEDLDALFDSIALHRPEAEPAAASAAAKEEQAEPAVPAPVVAVQPPPVPVVVAKTSSPAVDQNGRSPMPMYERLGGIVRELHNALRELGQDQALFDAVHEVFDSQERLKYIAHLTEQAANKVLNAVDESLPIQERQISQAHKLSERWQAMYEGKLDIEAFKLLAADSRDFTASVATNSEMVKAHLMDIMMAQDFQDITGQIIKKVVTLTGNLEGQLMQLLRDYAPTLGPRSKDVIDLLSGPNVPTASMVQGDVDSLLADLGF